MSSRVGARVAAVVFAGAALACGSEPQSAAPPEAGAVAALEQAAEAGDVRAQVELGNRYQDGEDVERDPARAAEWYRRAAEQGDASGQLALGTLYFYGIGLPRDWDESLVWVQKAADQGHPDAEFALGYIHASGRGVERDLDQAREWYRKAAEHGQTVAMYSMARSYLSWGDAYADEAQGLAWLERAAEAGHDLAQWQLGGYYAAGGLGLPRDYVEAYRWMLLADPTEDARLEQLEQVELKLTEEERAEGRRRADDWRRQRAQRTRGDEAPPG